MLTIEHLNVEYYRRRQVVRAVRDFSLAIAPGETVGLVGESGSGKSTVALAILRLFRPQEGRITSGRILFQGQDLLSLPEDQMRQIRGRRISMIFQDPFTSLNPVMRIEDQMAEGLTAHGMPADSATLAAAFERVRLEPERMLNSYPHQLSGGQRQRVMIAMALLGQPDLILADEPTTALDVLVQKDILELLFGLQKQFQISLLFISHNLALVARYTHRLVVMKAGETVEENTPAELFRAAHHPYTQELIKAIPKF